MTSSRTAWFHCFAGTAGDMTLGALVDAGADPDSVAASVAALPIDGYALTFERVSRAGVSATRAVVAVDDHRDGHQDGHEAGHASEHGHRRYAEIRTMIGSADLVPRVRDRALATFSLLAEVEARIHGVSLDEVEFHEVGSVDAIVDIVGSCAALESLGVDRIVCGPIAVGHGTVHAAHGELPNPAPAVVALLARRGVRVRGSDDTRELATPTGVALMVGLADEFGPLPDLGVEAVGYGAGRADIAGRPNVVQVVIGAATTPSITPRPGQPVDHLETNVDDVTGEVIGHTIAALLASGAHDAWAAPIVMKKGRPAFTVHALCDPASTPVVAAALVRETGSLGVRATRVERWPQRRSEQVVEVDGLPVRVKVGEGRAKAEFDDAVAVASATGRALRDVLDEAVRRATD